MSKIVKGIAIAVGVGLAIVSFQPWALPAFLGALSTSATFRLGIGLGLIATGLSGLTARKASGGSVLQSAQARQITSRQALAPRRIVYGTVRLGGILTFLKTTGGNNEYLHAVITLSGCQLTSIGQMYFDGNPVYVDGSGDGVGTYSGYVHVEKNLGTESQAAFPSLVAENIGWTSNHRQRGCAGVYVRLKMDASKQADLAVFPSGGVPNITFEVQGKPVYDPRLANPLASPPISGIAFSANGALIIADYLTTATTKCGFGGVYADDIDDTQLIAAANTCDENVALNTSPVTYEKRYEVHGVFESSETPGQILTDMFAAIAGAPTLSNKWAIYPGVYRTPDSTATLTADDFVGDFTISPLVSMRDLYNGVKGAYIIDGKGTDFPPVKGLNWLTQDGGERAWLDVQLPLTKSPTMAQRICKIMLEQSRRQMTLNASVKLGAYRFRAQEVVRVTLAKYGWVNKTFLCTECNLGVTNGDGGPVLIVGVVLRETDSNIYAWTPATDEGEVTTPSETNLLTAGDGPLSPAHGSAGAPAFGTQIVNDIIFGDTREASLYVADEDDNGFLKVYARTGPRTLSPTASRPTIIGALTTAATGGRIQASQQLWYGVAGVDAASKCSKMSLPAPVTIPAGTDTNTVTIPVSLEGAATMNVYRGRTSGTMRLIAPAVALASSYTDVGLGGGTAPPDSRVAGAELRWRRVRSVLLGPMLVDSGSALGLSSAAFAALGLSDDTIAGHIIEIVRGTFRNHVRVVSHTGGNIVIQGNRASIVSITRTSNVVTVHTSAPYDRAVTSGAVTPFTANIVGVTDASFNGTGFSGTVIDDTHFSFPQTAANASSSGGYADTGWTLGTPSAGAQFTVWYRASSAGASSITDSLAVWTASEFIGARVRILDGNGNYQEAGISANTTDTLTTDAPWTDIPTSSSFEIVDPSWNAVNAPVTGDFENVTAFTGTFQAPNQIDLIIELSAVTFDAQGNYSDPAASPVNRYAMIGHPDRPDRIIGVGGGGSVTEEPGDVIAGDIYLVDQVTNDLGKLQLKNGILSCEKV